MDIHVDASRYAILRAHGGPALIEVGDTGGRPVVTLARTPDLTAGLMGRGFPYRDTFNIHRRAYVLCLPIHRITVEVYIQAHADCDDGPAVKALVKTAAGLASAEARGLMVEG